MQFRRANSTVGRAIVAAVLVMVMAMLSTGCMNAGQSAALEALNRDRVAHGLPALRQDRFASAVAHAWALHLSKVGTLSHSSLRESFASVEWCALGENVGYGPGVEVIQDAYMGSPGHRGNILDPKWTGVGVGHRVKDGRTYTVQVFVAMC